MKKVYNLYEEAVDFMLENKHYEKGIRYAEYMKSRLFLDRLAEGLLRLEKGIKPDLKQK
jgi:hypothetical protein